MKFYCYKILLAFTLLGLWSCRSEDLEDVNKVSGGDQVIFGANVSKIVSGRGLPKRGLPKNGIIKDGDLHLAYLSKQGSYKTAEIKFEDGIGRTFIVNNKVSTSLLWDDLDFSNKTDQTYSFYYDNLIYDNSDNISYFILPKGHPYKFSKYKLDEDVIPDGDLLWGSVIGVKKSNSILLTLNHMMSLLTLQISIDNNGFEERKPKKAWITNCRSAVEKVHRMSGTVNEYSYISNDEIPKLPYLQLADEGENIYGSEDWKRTEDMETDVRYYDSPEFLVPPQQFKTGYLPRLTIELDDGTRYSGVFPQYMFFEEPNGSIAQWRMEFKSGYKLNLAVRISIEANSLNFIYASVNYWEDKGSFNITGRQASLADEKDFVKLIEAYISASQDEFKNDEDKYGFYQWGFLDEVSGKWVFNVFQNQSLNESAISGKMPEDPDIPYEFAFHYATLTLLMNDGTEVALKTENGGAEKLKDMLTKGAIETGIYSDSDLKLLAEAYKKSPSKNLEPWGGNRDGRLWHFSLYQDLELKASEFAGIMPENSTYKYDFVFGDKKVTIVLENKKKVVLSAENNGEATLKALLNEGVIPE